MAFKINYEVKVNDEGRPYIDIGDDFNGIPEHRFFAIEITRYILYDLIEKNRKRTSNSKIAGNIIDVLENTVENLTHLSDEMAVLIKGTMDTSLSLEELVKLNIYDIAVDSKSDLERIKDGFVFNDKIYMKKHGLKVRVLEDMCVYELQGDFENEHWVNLTSQKNTEDENPTNETQNQ